MPTFVIIVGGGLLGQFLASYLIEEGNQVRVIEERQELLPQLLEKYSQERVVLGSGTNPRVLEAAGARKANVLVAVTDADETNLVVANLARQEFNVPRIIARVIYPGNAWMFTPEMGVDVVLNQAQLLVHLIAEEMSMGDMMTLVKLRRGQYSLVEERVAAKSEAAGKTVGDLPLPEQCILVALIRKNELLIPRGTTIVQPGDEVLALAHTDALERLSAMLNVPATPR